MNINFEELEKTFLKGIGIGWKDIRSCRRCSSLLEYSRREHPVYGEQVYFKCPECFEKRVYPWDGFFIQSISSQIHKPLSGS